MKKSKIFIPIMSAVTATAAVTPFISSCKDNIVTPVIDEVTKSQFDSVTCNCRVNQDSTITFVPKQDQEIDKTSVSIKIDGTKLEETRDYKIYNNVITIFAAAMKSKNVTVSVNARYQHIIEGLEPHWIVKPLMTNDSITADDVIVYLNYKDGTQETLDWGADYEIYWVKKDGSKEELKNFKTTPFIFTIPGQDYNFEIVYTKDTRVKLPVNGICVNEPNESLFLAKYKQCLDNFKESEIYSKYGWATFDLGSKFMDENVASAALVYEEYEEDSIRVYSRAHFKDEKGDPTDYDCILGGYDIEQIKQTLKEYDTDDYVTQFKNTTTEFGFRVSKIAKPEEYNEVLFNKETYVTNWTNTMADETEEPYQNTKITNIKYHNYVKTAQLNAKIDSDDPIGTLEIYDKKIPTQAKKFLTETDNEFILKVSSKGEKRTGKVVIYNRGTTVYESQQMTITGTDTKMQITVSNWDKIDHNDTLNVRFVANEAFKVSLDQTLKDDGYWWKEEEPVLIESTKTKFVPKIWPKTGTETKDGTFYISYTDPISGNEKILSRSGFEEGTYNVDPVFEFDYQTWATVGKKEIVSATIKFTPARSATLSVGTKLQQLNPTLDPSETITESYKNEIKISWNTPLEKDTVFSITNNRTSKEVSITSAKAGATSITLLFDDWNNVQTGDTLTIEIKLESKLQVTCENDTYKLLEPQPGQKAFVQMYFVPGYFKYSDPNQEIETGNWSVKVENWKQTVGPTSGWKPFGNWWHSCDKFDEEWLNVILVADGAITPLEGDEYTFDIILTFNGSDTYKEFKFTNMKVQIYWPN